MISRLAGIASALLAVMSFAVIWSLAKSPDSGLHVGLIVAAPSLAIAIGLGLLAYWTSERSETRGRGGTRVRDRQR